MRAIEAALALLRILGFVGGLILTPICVVFVFQGGWFVGPMYWLAWEKVHLAYKGLRQARRAGARDKSLGTALDQLLAQTHPSPPALYVQLEGTQVISDEVESVDLGYPTVRLLPSPPIERQCPSCYARSIPPPDRKSCRFCDTRLPTTTVSALPERI